jgi:hypothetical protein
MTAPRSAGAVRQERYRRHRRGDHAVCLEGHCDDVTPPPAQPPAPAAPALETPNEAGETALPGEAFGPSGRAVWDGTLKFGSLTATQRVLLREVCRMTDRADYLHEQIEEFRDDPGTVKWLLREARQQAIAMKGIVGELRQSGAAGGWAPPTRTTTASTWRTSGTPQYAEGGPGIADITARIAERLSQATG